MAKDTAAEVIKLSELGMTAEAIAKYLGLDVRMVEWVLRAMNEEV